MKPFLLNDLLDENIMMFLSYLYQYVDNSYSSVLEFEKIHQG
jgi:hypothetical protein